MNSDEILEQELRKQNLITKEQLAECKEEKARHTNKKLSEILLEKKLLTQEQLKCMKLPEDDYQKALEDIEKVLNLQEKKSTPTISSQENREEKKEKLSPIKKTITLEKQSSLKHHEKEILSSESTADSQKSVSGIPDNRVKEEIAFSSLKKTKILEKLPSSKPLTKPLNLNEEKPSPVKKTTAFEMMSSDKPIGFEDEFAGKEKPIKKTAFVEKMPHKEHEMIHVPTEPKSESKDSDPLLMSLPPIPEEDKQEDIEENIDIPFGKACVILRFATEDQVQTALEEQAKYPGKTLGEIMVSMNILTPDKVKTILSRQKSQTLICYACNKKYQIVMYQAGRSYKCKLCNRELEKFSETKARKRKEQLDLMGITQAVSLEEISKEKKIDTKGIDFAASAQQESQSVLNTSDILKKVGVLGTRDYRKSLTKKKKINYTRISLGIFMLGLLSYFVYYLVVVIFSNIPDKIETKPIHYTEETKKYFPEEKKQLDETEQMNLEFQRLSRLKQNEENAEGLKVEIAAWQNFLNTYPQTPDRDKATEQIYHLQDLLKKTIEKNDFAAFEQAFGAKMSVSDMAGAEKILEEYQKISNDSFYLQQYSERGKNLQVIAKEIMDKEINSAMQLAQEKKYEESLSILERNKKLQIASCVPVIESKIAEVKAMEERFLWGNAALQIARKVYPILMEKKYKEAIPLLDKQKQSYPQYQKHFDQWIIAVKKAEEFWEKCKNIFLSNKDKEMLLEIVDGGEKKVIPKSFSPKTENLVLLWQNKFKNIKLGQLSNHTFKKLLLNEKQSKETIAQLGLFLALLKNPKTIREEFPEIFEDSIQEQIFCIYVTSSIFYNIEQKNFSPLEEIFKELKNSQSGLSFLQNSKEEIAKKLWESFELEKTAKKKTTSELLLKMILEYFKDTVFAQYAKEAQK